MLHLTDEETLETVDCLVAFSDLTQFTRASAAQPSWHQVFQLMSDYFEFVGDLVSETGGTLIKCIGDAALMVYPQESAEQGVLALMRLLGEGDHWCKARDLPCRHRIKVHYGPVVCGMIGGRGDKRLDVYGETVNTAATMRTNGIAISPQAFRRLSADSRKLFKKHTPPVTYIPTLEHH